MLFRNELDKQREISFDQLAQEKFWLLRKGHCFRNQMINLCSPNDNKDEQFQYESGSLESLKNLVLNEGGATLLPELATESLSEEEKEKVVSIGPDKPYREVSLVQTRMQAKKRLIEAFLNQIELSIPKEMQLPKENIIDWN